MNIFDPKQLCPKCHGSNLHHRYRKAGQLLDEGWGDLGAAECEMIRTHCRTCGHKWNSLPADTEVVKANDVVRDSSDYSYETVQDGYVIYDGLGRQVEPWKLVQILNSALVLSGSL